MVTDHWAFNAIGTSASELADWYIRKFGGKTEHQNNCTIIKPGVEIEHYAGLVHAITLFNKFAGDLPAGLRFGLPNSEARMSLGKPIMTGRENIDGASFSTDNYQSDDVRLFCVFEEGYLWQLQFALIPEDKKPLTFWQKLVLNLKENYGFKES